MNESDSVVGGTPFNFSPVFEDLSDILRTAHSLADTDEDSMATFHSIGIAFNNNNNNNNNTGANNSHKDAWASLTIRPAAAAAVAPAADSAGVTSAADVAAPSHSVENSSTILNPAVTEVFDPEFKFIYEVPSGCVVHLPPPRLNITRLVLCRNYKAFDQMSCTMGHNCKFVHSDCDYNTLQAHPIHVNYIWRSKELCTYARLPAGDVLEVLQLNGEVVDVESSSVLATRAAVHREELPAPLSVCSHYEVKGMCYLGERCLAVHRMTIDPNVKGDFKRATRKPDHAAQATPPKSAATAAAVSQPSPGMGSNNNNGVKHNNNNNNSHEHGNPVHHQQQGGPGLVHVVALAGPANNNASVAQAMLQHQHQQQQQQQQQHTLVPTPFITMPPNGGMNTSNNYVRIAAGPPPQSSTQYVSAPTAAARSPAMQHVYVQSSAGAEPTTVVAPYPWIQYAQQQNTSNNNTNNTNTSNSNNNNNNNMCLSNSATSSSKSNSGNRRNNNNNKQQQQRGSPSGSSDVDERLRQAVAQQLMLASRGPQVPQPSLSFSLPAQAHTAEILNDPHSLGTLLYLPKGATEATVLGPVPLSAAANGGVSAMLGHLNILPEQQQQQQRH